MRTTDDQKVSPAENSNNTEKIITSPVNNDIQSLGDLKIHENVISSIVRRATLSQKGVSRLSGNNFVDTIGEIVGSRRIQDRAIMVRFTEDNRIELEIKVIIKIGYVVPEVAAAVQKSVITEVERTTGMTVTAVNVTVQDVEEEFVDEDEDSEE